MTWKVRLVDIDALNAANAAPLVGDAWFRKPTESTRHLSPEYRRDWDGKRAPIDVKLPGGQIWCMDMVAFNKGVPTNSGWSVSGPIPEVGKPFLLTASPSILTSRYHGYLRDGELTNDQDGRNYNKFGSVE